MAVKEDPNIRPYLSGVRFKGKVARVVEADFRVWQIAFPGFSARRHEKGIVFTPHGL